MLTEEAHSAGVEAGTKIAQHEDAAHEKRNWVRLTFDCNNRCVFCLDSDTHDGRMRDKGEVKQQILDGRRAGATRLILSGGEPTIHPNYVDFIKLGKMAGYEKIQTVTNGRLFQYQDYLDKCLAAGLDEITFSLHGPNARIHDALVGVKGAFEQESAGLRRAVATRDARGGRPIVNVDIVINRANVKHLEEMLELFISWGVKEFDLLQVVPFGRAFTEGRDTLFYDLEEMRPYLLRAFAYTKRPDLHIWLNRFPPPHLEGYEHLIQDPYKLNDEVRGRKEEFARLLDEGQDLDCRDPHRCRYCYLEKLCDGLYAERDALAARRFEAVRVDATPAAAAPVVFGGDPASARRASGRVALPVVGGGPAPARVDLAEVVRASGARRLVVVAPDLAAAERAAARFPDVPELELDLADPRGAGPTLGGRRVAAVVARTPAQAEALLAAGGDAEVVVLLSKRTAPWLLELAAAPARLALRQPTHERLTESADEDVDLADFFARFRHAEVPVEGVPACLLGGRAPRPAPATLDTAMLTDEGALEIFRFTRRHILAGYFTKSLRCKGCVHDARCRGLHVSYVRAHGYACLVPVRP